MIIQYQDLSEEAFTGICREYVISQITDNDAEVQLEKWVEIVKNRVKNGELLVEFAEANETVALKLPEEIHLVQE